MRLPYPYKPEDLFGIEIGAYKGVDLSIHMMLEDSRRNQANLLAMGVMGARAAMNPDAYVEEAIGRITEDHYASQYLPRCSGQPLKPSQFASMFRPVGLSIWLDGSWSVRFETNSELLGAPEVSACFPDSQAAFTFLNNNNQNKRLNHEAD